MTYRFGIFEFDSDTLHLRKNGRAVALEPQPAKALAHLLSNSGALVSREQLRDAVWDAGTHVDFDRGLAYCISQIRTALGDSADNPRFVQTVPKRGFRFVAPSSYVAPAGPVLPVLQAPPPFPPRPKPSRWTLFAAVLFFALVGASWFFLPSKDELRSAKPAVVAVSIFDNETGLPAHDRLVAGLSDLVVARLAAIDRERLAVIGNAAILRQPRNLRNLSAIADSVNADYVLLGQLQTGETGLRFITHFIRMRDEAHLKANRLVMPGGGIDGLEGAVVEEFERAVREHVLNRRAN